MAEGKSSSVLFLDSGVGGLPYHAAFAARNPRVKTVYIADAANFPYGPKSKQTLTALLSALTASLIRRFNPGVIVIACNTASVTALDALRAQFPSVPFVGTVPAIKPAALHSVSGLVGVLGTELTTAAPYTGKLLEEANTQAGKRCALVHLAAPELVEFVEHDFWSADAAAKTAVVRTYTEYFRERGVDSVVLGCTHFLLLLDSFIDNAGGMVIFHSIDGVCRQIEKTLATNCAGADAGADAAAQFAAEPATLYSTGGGGGEKWRRAAAYFRMTARPLPPEEGFVTQ